mmetsp:Transcript_8622/g.9799  ORF Transcript_8622/g.9799 Transcript_8622/m.9799 type:complete len:322 (+) Transcript_8622:27-992(+)
MKLFVALATLVCAEAHVMWMWPEPREDSRFGFQKEYPCGEGLRDKWDRQFTTMRPGRQTVKFRETVNHEGSPYRISISVGSDDHYDEHVLLDFIPHNANGSMFDHPDTPRQGKWHDVDIVIPDIDCSDPNTRCALQLVQIMTDKMPNGCRPEDLPESCGHREWVYFTCANVRIMGSQPAADLPRFYNSWLDNTEPAPWMPGTTTQWKHKMPENIWVLPPTHIPEIGIPAGEGSSNELGDGEDSILPVDPEVGDTEPIDPEFDILPVSEEHMGSGTVIIASGSAGVMAFALVGFGVHMRRRKRSAAAAQQDALVEGDYARVA